MPFKYNPLSGNLDLVQNVSSFGDLSGPASSTDNAIPRFDGTGGETLQDSSVIIDDSDNVSGVSQLTATSISLTNPVDETMGGTGQTTYSTGDILYSSAPNTLSKLAVGSDGSVLTLAAGIPSWAASGKSPKEVVFSAGSFESNETNPASLELLNGTTVKTLVRAFDDTTVEYVNGKFQVPGDIDTSGTVTFRAYIMAATAAASKNVELELEHLAINSAEDFDQAYTAENSGDIAIDATQDNVTEATWTETVSNLGWAANDLVFFRLSRTAPSANNLTGDMYLYTLSLEIPRS